MSNPHDLHGDWSVANESETEDWQHRDIAMADLEHRLSSAEAELRETAGELEKARARVIKLEAEREQDLSQLLRGTVAMENAITDIDSLRARLTEATALLERCLPLSPIGSELRGFIRDWLRGLSRAPAQPAAPVVYHGRSHSDVFVLDAAQPAAPTPGRFGYVHDLGEPAAPEPSELQKRLDATNAMRERAESAEAQLAAVRGELLGWCRVVRDMTSALETVRALLERWNSGFNELGAEYPEEETRSWLSSNPAPSPGAGGGK